MRFHPEVLEARQLQVLDATGPSLTARGFRLGDGTGLAQLLGHRMSEDFDWFSTEPMADPMRLAREIQDEGVALRVQQVARGTIHGTVDGVRLSLLEFSYPLLAEPMAGARRGRPLPDDIACMKRVQPVGRVHHSEVLDVSQCLVLPTQPPQNADVRQASAEYPRAF